MNDIVLNLIVFILLAGAGIVIYLLVSRNKAKKEDQFLTNAARLGWRVSPVREDQKTGWRIESTAAGKVLPFTWAIESVTVQSAPSADESTSPNFSRVTIWSSEAAALKDGMVLIGPKIPSSLPVLNSSLIGNTLVQGALRMMLGEDAAQLIGLAEVQAGSSDLRKRWSVWAHDPAQANRLLSAEVEAALDALPAGLMVIIRLNRQRLVVEVRDRQITDTALLQKLTNLGERMVETWC